jgi:hypothetical protein
MAIMLKAIFKFYAILTKIPMIFFTEIEKKSNMHIEAQNIQNSKNSEQDKAMFI